MKSFVLISAVCLQLGWSYGSGINSGAGAFSYQDSSGKRYEGTYGLKDGEVVDAKGTFPPNFSPPDFSGPNFSGPDFAPDFSPTFNDLDDNSGFFPDYFRNLENLLQDSGFEYYPPIPQIPQIPQFIPTYSPRIPVNIPIYNYYDHHRAFQANLENQKLALNAARKAFDLTSNRAHNNHLNPFSSGPFDYGFSGFQDPQFPFNGDPMNPGNDASGAYAAAAAGPGYSQQTARVYPGNPSMPNIDKISRSESGPGYHSVSVSSYSTSSDVDGKKTSKQGATTTVNKNGKVSTYSVQSP